MVMLVKILELIYYKCVTPEQRDKDLLGVQAEKARIEDADE